MKNNSNTANVVKECMYKTVSKETLTGTIDVEGLTTFSYPNLVEQKLVNLPAGRDIAGIFIKTTTPYKGGYNLS